MQPGVGKAVGTRSGRFGMKQETTAGRLHTGWLRSLPEFVILGAMKSGTTTLYWMLADHPAMDPPLRKEIHFFDTFFHQGVNWYRSHFPLRVRKHLAALRGKPWITGEGTPYYLFHPLAAERAKATVPHAKLIVLLRNPVDRAYSQYQMQVKRGEETLPFEEAMENETRRLDSELARMREDPDYYSDVHRRFSYVSRGLYLEQLQRWFRHFPREQLLVLNSSDFRRDARGTYAGVLQFLGMPDWWSGELKNRRVEKYPPLDPATRKRLAEYYAPHNQALYRFIDRDLGWESE